MLEKLEKILSIEKKEHQYDWEKVEDSYEIKFPNDYKSFIEYYGEGRINEFLWILSPFSEYENLNTIFIHIKYLCKLYCNTIFFMIQYQK